MELKFYIKKRQLYDLYGNPIVAIGNTPANVGVQGGTIPNNNWVDITGDVEEPESLSITFTESRDDNGMVSQKPGVRFYKKAATGNFSITGDAYKYVYDWVYGSPTSLYNSFSLRVEDVGCGFYDELTIGRNSIVFCENNVCRFDMVVRQEDEVFHCIQKTLISDNWQGWFQEQPLGGKQYPRFSYCNEPKQSLATMLIWFVFINVIVGSGSGILVVLATIINPIIAVINVFANPNINYINPFKTPTYLITLMFESAGCGREHTAPFIRDYIKNVCDKCGVDVDATTAPAFFATHLTMSTASGGINNEVNPHYNATWMHPKYKRGVRRYKDLWAMATYQDPDTTTFFQTSNAPQYALSDFLDMIKGVYNSEWRIRKVNGKETLFFLRKDWFLQGQYVYNFQHGSPDRDKIIQGVCFEPTELKYPAYIDGIFKLDLAEQGNVEVLEAYNGKAYNFGQLTEKNTLYEGSATEVTQYVAPTKFALDGSDNDYIYDSFQLALNSAWGHISLWMITNPFALSGLDQLAKDMSDFIKKYVNNAIYLQGDVVDTGRIIIWDGNSMLNARAMRLHSGVMSSASTKPMPTPLQPYNANSEPFDKMHPRQTKVRGLGGTFGTQTPNAFEVRFAGMNVYLKEPCELPNTPMYFNAGFQGGLWDWWWFIEDPRHMQKMGLKWSVEIENCCDDRSHLNVYTHSGTLKLGYTVKLPLPYINTGVIEEIEINYKPKKDEGRIIRLSGTV